MKQIHVAPHGRDDHAGTPAQPLLTPTASRDLARGQGPCEIVLHAGRYELSQSLVLDERDRHTTWRCDADAQAKLCGSRSLSNLQPLDDSPTSQRVPAASRPHVRMVDLGAMGLDGGQMTTQGFGHKIAPKPLEVYAGDQRMTWTRYPREGWLRIADWTKPLHESHGMTFGNPAFGFNYDDPRPEHWQVNQDIWLYGYWAWDWADEYQKLKTLDLAAKHVVTHQPNDRYGYRKGNRFVFMNILEELTAAGQFYADRETNRLYLWLPPGADPNEVFVTVLTEPLVTIRDAQNIRFENIILEQTRGMGVELIDSQSCLFNRCTLRHLGSDAVQVSGGRGNRFEYCHIHDVGDHGIHINAGDRTTLTPAHHHVGDCHLHDLGVWCQTYRPAVSLRGVGQTLEHCHIHDHPHMAVYLAGNDHVISHNDIHHVCWNTDDCGAIYIGRDWTERGHKIQYNHIHDYAGVGQAVIAIYLDDLAGGLDIIGNVIQRGKIGILLGGSRDVDVSHNLFYRCGPAIQVDARGLEGDRQWTNLLGMVVDNFKKMLPYRAVYHERYPDLFTVEPMIDQGRPVPPANVHVHHNIFATNAVAHIGWHATDDMLDIRDNVHSPSNLSPDLTFPPESLPARLGTAYVNIADCGIRST